MIDKTVRLRAMTHAALNPLNRYEAVTNKERPTNNTNRREACIASRGRYSLNATRREVNGGVITEMILTIPKNKVRTAGQREGITS